MRFNDILRRSTIGLALASALLGGAAAEPVSPPVAPAKEAQVFARVDGAAISVLEFETALANGVREKFYHRRPPPGELARFSREVGENLVMRAVLTAEAERRRTEPDRAGVERQIAEYDRRYAANEQWKRAREQVLPRLAGELERRSRLERLEAALRDVPLPSEEEARAFHASTPQLFTEPEQFRFSLILVKLDPAATDAAREAAMAEGTRLHERLKGGADFAELARAHSGDPSSKDGGDLGYVHRGMLPEAIETQFADSLKPGEFSPPTRILEGVAIVRLDARKAPRMRAFDEVASQARQLLQRERGEQAWSGLKAGLRASAAVWLDESRFEAVDAR